MQVNEYENGVCPEWLQVERIVAHKGGAGEPDDGTKYLVKWEVLGYQECTWEATEDLTDDTVRALMPVSSSGMFCTAFRPITASRALIQRSGSPGA